MSGDEFYDDEVTSGRDLSEPEDCAHLNVEWGDGIADFETGIVEDPDHLGICVRCGAWMARDGERRWVV